MSSSPSPPSGSQDANFWGVFNPTSKEFHEAENAFHSLEWHQQLAVVAAAILGGIILPVIGAFPAFCWVAQWIKPGDNPKADKVTTATENIFPEKPQIMSSVENEDSAQQPKVTLTPSPLPPASDAQQQNTTPASTQINPQSPSQKETQPSPKPSFFEKIASKTAPLFSSTKNDDETVNEKAVYLKMKGHLPASITFSDEIKENFNISWLFTRNCNEDPRFQNLLNFLKSLKFDPPIDYDHLTTFELLMTAIATASGHFLRSDGKWAIGDEPLIQVRTFKVLNDLLIHLYQDKSLPELLRQEIKNDYLWRVRCLFEHFAGSFQDTPNQETWSAGYDIVQQIEENPKEISLFPSLDPLFTLIEDLGEKELPHQLTLKMHDPEAHPRILRWEWALSSLNLKHTSFMNPEEKLFLKMEEVAGKSLIPGLLIPVLKDRKVEPDVYRMAQSILQLLRKDEELFRAKFETCFPEQSFISYRGKLYDSYAFLELSPDPTIFEIPLLAEAYQLKVSYYVIDEQGNVRIEHIGPEHAPPHSSLMLAKHTQYPRIQYILSAE